MRERKMEKPQAC